MPTFFFFEFLKFKKLKKYEMAMFVESFQLGCSRTYIVVFNDVEFKTKKKKKRFFFFYFGRLNFGTCHHVCGVQHGTKDAPSSGLYIPEIAIRFQFAKVLVNNCIEE